MTQEFVTLPREVVERTLDTLGNTETVSREQYEAELFVIMAIRAALEQPQGEQEAAPNGATHIQLQQGAFYKRVDGKWYVWSLMKNGEPHRWYISPGTAESCLEPLAATPKQKREPLTNEQVKAGLIHLIEYTDARERCAFNIGVRFAERAHGIK